MRHYCWEYTGLDCRQHVLHALCGEDHEHFVNSIVNAKLLCIKNGGHKTLVQFRVLLEFLQWMILKI